MRQDIRTIIEKNRTRIIDLARDLVKINSENHPPTGNEGEIQSYIAGFWAKHDIECDSFIPTDVPGFTSHPAYYDDGRNYENRPVVVAKLPGAGGGKSLIFSGHIDTVPLGNVEWKHDPYSAEIEDGKLYGRGAFDMKGGVAAMMMAAVLLREMGVRLKGDLIVETTPDEEFAGSNGPVAARARGYMADAAIITEPTGLTVVTGQRGFRLAQIAIAGKTGIDIYGGQSGNPVEHLTPVLQGIETFRKARLRVTKDDTVMITKLAANEFRADELLTVPPECRIEVYWQLEPEDDLAEVDAEFEAAIKNACAVDPYFVANPVEISYHLRPMPGSRVSHEAEIVKETVAVVESITGKPAQIITAFAPCDMFVFNRCSGIPALVFGPRGDGAHAPDEYVVVEDLALCAEIYMNVAINWLQVA
ncbi:MAG: M20/M25/M40 family metallo-hydrolase [Armatimonadota bacterium]|nr:M20/M25/M40 family metallo-hydrolase [Armatimonadota bacterium]